jgi:hypothetical protein
VDRRHERHRIAAARDGQRQTLSAPERSSHQRARGGIDLGE